MIGFAQCYIVVPTTLHIPLVPMTYVNTSAHTSLIAMIHHNLPLSLILSLLTFTYTLVAYAMTRARYTYKISIYNDTVTRTNLSHISIIVPTLCFLPKLSKTFRLLVRPGVRPCPSYMT